MLFCLDTVIDEIVRTVGERPPEAGGALLGPVGKSLVTHFVFDDEAEVSAVTYRPSARLTERVQTWERAANLELKGIVHSHPGRFDRPSSQDHETLAVSLARNPHLGAYLAPIMTLAPAAAALAPHELAAGRGKLSFYVAYRQTAATVQVIALAVTEVPMRRHLDAVGAHYGIDQPPEVFTTEVAGVEFLAGRLILNGGLELLLLASELYPAVPPLLLVTPAGGATEQVQIGWSLNVPAEERLLAALKPLLRPPGPYQLAFGPADGPSLTSDAQQAARLGWVPQLSGQSPAATGAAIEAGLLARGAGLLSQELRTRRALIVGLGSVGSDLAEQLVRAGVGALDLVDPETVEPANLARTVYTAADLDRAKTEALARRLWQINPAVTLSLHQASVAELTAPVLDELVRAADLVVAATDDPRAQLTLNRFAYAGGTPALFIGLYAGARGGEVILSLPERTPCYLCATGSRREFEAVGGPVQPGVDYGSGRLAGEVALAADIRHVTSAAVKLGLALLVPPTGASSLTAFLDEAIAAQLSYLTIAMTPDYWFYPSIFGDTPGQYAYQSVWLSPTSRPDCPVCGAPTERIEPLDVPLQGPRLSEHGPPPVA